MKADDLPDFMQFKFLINYRSNIVYKIRRYISQTRANGLLDLRKVKKLINYLSIIDNR